mmetsp:Transcript_13970/g.58340  ORF Transcript_13970/g.58340 Transcript_13970/m.58340 type:complete len:202 (-) Transcript_13970:145-750(-)
MSRSADKSAAPSRRSCSSVRRTTPAASSPMAMRAACRARSSERAASTSPPAVSGAMSESTKWNPFDARERFSSSAARMGADKRRSSAAAAAAAAAASSRPLRPPAAAAMAPSGIERMAASARSNPPAATARTSPCSMTALPLGTRLGPREGTGARLRSMPTMARAPFSAATCTHAPGAAPRSSTLAPARSSLCRRSSSRSL